MNGLWMSVMAALLCVGASATAQDDTGLLRFRAPVFKAKGADASSLKFSPFKAGKGSFQVTVDLISGVDDSLLHSEVFEYHVKTSAASNPDTGLITVASTVDGVVDVILGAQTPLPFDLLEGDVWFTTQVDTLKNGEVHKSYPASPLQPLGIAGGVKGQDLELRSVTLGEGLVTPSLQLTEGVTEGWVLTADAAGNATWKPADNIAVGAVGSTQILDDSITSADIGPDAVGGSELAPDAVGSEHIVNGSVTGADIMAATITGGLIAPDAVTSAHIVADTLTAADIAPDAIGTVELADNSVGSANIINGSVTGSDIASSAITGSHIAASTITSSDIANSTITGSDIASNTITSSDLAEN